MSIFSNEKISLQFFYLIKNMKNMENFEFPAVR